MIKKKLPVGISDFREIIENNYYFVDKSMLIDELLNKRFGVTLLPRPRGFGKTLNMSMLNYFFDIENKESNKKLFDGLAISRTDKMKYQGKYPVIYISLKSIKANNWKLCLEKLNLLLQSEYNKYNLTLERKKENSLLDLSRFLYEKYNKKVVILIDEYDTPLVTAYLQGYYDKVVLIFQNFLSAALKGNPYLEFSVITGNIGFYDILPNNIYMSTILEKDYNYFGFNLREINELLKRLDKNDYLQKVIENCGGYKTENDILFSPDLTFKFLTNNLEQVLIELEEYFVCVADKEDKNFRKKLQELKNFNKIEECIEKTILCLDINYLNTKISILLFCGYLTYQSFKMSEITGIKSYILIIPNEKIKVIINKFLNEN